MTATDHPASRLAAPPRRTADRAPRRDEPCDAFARQIDENLKRLYCREPDAALPPELHALVARLRERRAQE